MRMARRIAPLALALAAGCSAPAPGPPPPPADTGSAAPPAQEAAGDAGLVMSGINLYMHRSRQPEGMAQKPQFWVHADTFSIQGENDYQFERARAVIYGSEGDREEIVIEALRGQFEQDRHAVLRDEVRVAAGTLRMRLEDISWDKPEGDAPGVAFSERPVAVEDEGLKLEAGGVRLYPDEKIFELTGVTGVVRFGKESP